MKKIDEFEENGISYQVWLDGTEGLGLGAGYLGTRDLGQGDFSIMWLDECADAPVFLTAYTAICGTNQKMIRTTRHCERGNLVKIIKKIQKLEQLSHWHSIKV